MPKRGVHDMGGDAAGPIDTHEHVPTMTERRIDALMQLLRNKPRGFWTTDENRRTIESLTPKTYNDAGYYERWAYAMRSLLIEKGVLNEAEVTKRLAEVKARMSAPGKAKSKAATGKAKSPDVKSAVKKAAAAKPSNRTKPPSKLSKT